MRWQTLLLTMYFSILLLKQQSVSEWVSESVCLFPNSSETANSSELKFWGMIPLGMEEDLG